MPPPPLLAEIRTQSVQSQILFLVGLTVCHLQHLLPSSMSSSCSASSSESSSKSFLCGHLHEHLEVVLGAVRPVLQRIEGICSKA